MGAFFCFFLTTSERTLRGLVKPRLVTSKQRVLTKNLGFSQIFSSFDSRKKFYIRAAFEDGRCSSAPPHIA
ncbi:hypothetical protein KO116_03050 [Halomonas sp. KO116]|nr:hypothetical protein KO116_03050 [Halomonas sp. KO116]